jgi:hypothetical protein
MDDRGPARSSVVVVRMIATAYLSGARDATDALQPPGRSLSLDSLNVRMTPVSVAVNHSRVAEIGGSCFGPKPLGNTLLSTASPFNSGDEFDQDEAKRNVEHEPRSSAYQPIMLDAARWRSSMS